MSRLKSIKDKMTSKEKVTVVLSEGGSKKEKVLWEGKESNKAVVPAPPKPPKENKVIKAVKGGVRDAGDFVKQGTVHVAKGVTKGTQKAVGVYSKAYTKAGKKMKNAPEGFLGFVGGVKIKKGKGKKGKVKLAKTPAPGMATKKETRYMTRVAGQTRSTAPQFSVGGSGDSMGFGSGQSSTYSLGGFGGDSMANAYGNSPAYSPKYPRPRGNLNDQFSNAFGGGMSSIESRGATNYRGAFGNMQSGEAGRSNSYSGAFGKGMGGKGKKNQFGGAFRGF